MPNSQAANWKGTPLRKLFIGLCSIVFVATACAHVYQLNLEWHLLKRAAELQILTSPFFASLQISFIVAFVSSAIGLVVNQLSGRIAAVVGLIIVLLNYALWYGFSYRTLQAIGDDPTFSTHPEYIPPSLLGLVGGRWWDFLALFVALAVLGYMIRELRPRLSRAS